MTKHAYEKSIKITKKWIDSGEFMEMLPKILQKLVKTHLDLLKDNPLENIHFGFTKDVVSNDGSMLLTFQSQIEDCRINKIKLNQSLKNKQSK